MIRIFLILLIFFGIPTAVFPQADFGIKAGINIADIVMTNIIDPDAESDLVVRIGPHAGFFVSGSVNERVGASAELLYSSKGVSDIHLHYITLPLLFQYRLTERFVAELGLEPGYMFSSRSDFGNVSSTYNNKLDLAVAGGFGFDFDRVVLSMRYCAGVFSVREPLQSAASPGERVKYQNRVLQLSLGYKLWQFE